MRLWALHRLGYQIRDLYDIKNHPGKLEDLITMELEMMRLNKKEQMKIIESIMGVR